MMFTRFRNLQAMLLLITTFMNLNLIKSTSFENNNNDPFAALGIPDLSPKKVMDEIDKKAEDPRNNKSIPQLKSMEDLPNFLKLSNINEEDGIKILTRFLIQDDFTLKKYGVVYDQTGFDGLGKEEIIAPIGTEERLNQRAKSSANIWFKEKYPKLSYEAYGTEPQLDEIVPNWRVFKVLMIGGKGETTYLKICLPLDESETALVSDKDEPCLERANFVDKEKDKNEDYINKIRTNNFFKKKKSGNGLVKLLPGEKMIVKDNHKNIVLDSHALKQQSANGFLNPPSVDSSNDSPYMAALKNKRSMFNNNKPQMGMNNMMNNFGNNFRQQNLSPNQVMQNPNMSMMNLNNNNFRFNQLGGQPMNPNQNNYINNQLKNPMNNNGFGNFRFNSNNNFNNANNKMNSDPSKEMASPQDPANGNNNNNMPNQPLQGGFPNPNNPNPIPVMTPADPNNNFMNEFKQLKEQMMKLAEELKQKDEIIKQQNSKLNSNGIKLDNMPAAGNQSASPESQINSAPAAQSTPNPVGNQLQLPNAIPSIPQNNPGMNAPMNNMGYNQINPMGMNMNNFGAGQNMIPMNQMNNFMNPQMGNFNPGNMGGFGVNGMNPMMPMQPGMRPFNPFSPQQRKNLREVL